MLVEADLANGVDPDTPLQVDPQPEVQVAAETKPKRQRKATTAPTGEARVAIEKWNAVAKARGLDPVNFVNATVEGKVRARLQEVGGIDGWDKALALVERSPFLLGKVSSKVPGKKPFKATLAWVTGPVNFAKVMNETYVDSRAKAPAKPAAPREASPYDHPDFG
jgi:hypothetical protein